MLLGKVAYMAQKLSTSTPPDRHSPLVRKEVGYSVRRGAESPRGSTEDSPAIPASRTRVDKAQRKTGRKG